jgi:hypothetical protein
VIVALTTEKQLFAKVVIVLSDLDLQMIVGMTIVTMTAPTSRENVAMMITLLWPSLPKEAEIMMTDVSYKP